MARNARRIRNAALLFADFVISPEGQRLFESMGRVPASTRVKSELNNFPFTMIEPAIGAQAKPRSGRSCGAASFSPSSNQKLKDAWPMDALPTHWLLADRGGLPAGR